MFKTTDDYPDLRVVDLFAMVLLSEGKSQTATAAALNHSQPYVNKMIKRVERAYGFKIGSGVKKQWRLNDDGVALADQMKVAIDALNGSGAQVDVAEKITEVKRKAAQLLYAANEL